MSPVQISAVDGMSFDEILALEGFPDDSDATVYLSGSIVSDFGNPWSDIDVFVISDRNPIGAYAKHTDTNDTSQHYVGNRRVDFEFWRPSRVQELTDRLSRFELGSGKEIQGTLFLQIEECFIHRLRIGIPLLNADQFATYQSMFDFDHFRAYKTEDVIRYLDAVLEDLCGMIECGDRDVALFSARELIGGVIDAYCHKLGNTDPVRKWRVKYLEKFGDGTERHREIVETFWRLQFPDGAAFRANWDECRDYLEQCIRFSNRIISWIQS